MSVQWITYKGKRILRTDQRGLTEAQLIENGEVAVRIIEQSPEKVLALDNFAGAVVSRKFMKVLQEWAPRLDPHTEKEAVVITSGLADAVFNLYNMFSGRNNVRAFSTEEEAKEWLVS